MKYFNIFGKWSVHFLLSQGPFVIKVALLIFYIIACKGVSFESGFASFESKIKSSSATDDGETVGTSNADDGETGVRRARSGSGGSGGGDDPESPPPGRIDDPEDPPPGRIDDPEDPPPGTIDDPEDPPPGTIDDPESPPPGTIDDPEDPPPGTIDDPEDPPPGTIDDPEDPPPGTIDDPEDPPPGTIDDPEDPPPVLETVETIITKLNQVDIVFVVDNSPSMEEEQASIANQFDSFLNDIKDWDYQVAIITTDISDRGRFIRFSNGKKFLSNLSGSNSVHSANISYFQNAVQMGTGGSVDERGIYNLNLALDRSENSDFFRSNALLMVVIVSDEDEYSNGGIHVPPYPLQSLEEYDLPETFFRRFQAKNLSSTVIVHSIIVKPSPSGVDCQSVRDAGGTTHRYWDLCQCQQQQNVVSGGIQTTIGGTPGTVYARASDPSSTVLRSYESVRRGHIGSICAIGDYDSQLGAIAGIMVNVPPLLLSCIPRSSSISVKVNNVATSSFRVEGYRLFIEGGIAINSEAEVRYICQ